MKAIHLYIGVLIGCATVIGMGVNFGQKFGDATATMRQIATAVDRLERTSAAQSSEIQALRADLNGVKLETNTYMAYQDGVSRTERRTRTTPRFPESPTGIR
jgi:hypothetical protein